MDISIDLETLDTATSAVVLSIGACSFNADGVQSKFYRELRLNEQVANGRTISVSTVQFWMREAMAPGAYEGVLGALLNSDKLRSDVYPALVDFHNWFNDHIGTDGTVWANDPDFDCSIWASMCKSYGVTPEGPWKYNQKRSYRTIREVANWTGATLNVPPNKAKHNALEDAIHQANYIMACKALLGAS